MSPVAGQTNQTTLRVRCTRRKKSRPSSSIRKGCSSVFGPSQSISSSADFGSSLPRSKTFHDPTSTVPGWSAVEAASAITSPDPAPRVTRQAAPSEVRWSLGSSLCAKRGDDLTSESWRTHSPSRNDSGAPRHSSRPCLQLVQRELSESAGGLMWCGRRPLLGTRGEGAHRCTDEPAIPRPEMLSQSPVALPSGTRVLILRPK